MTPILRAYQEETVARVIAAIEAGKRAVILVAPTGSGKTVIAAAIVEIFVKTGKRVLFLAHRRELISQASRKLHDAGIDHGIVAAGFPARPGARVQVGSVQTVHARAIRSDSMQLPAADLVLIDECHHVRARTYQSILAAYPNARIIGLTATPCRGDGRGLGSDFDVMIEAPQVPQLIAGGFLVSTKVFGPYEPDLRGVHTRHGDYVDRELDAVMNQGKLIGDIATHWHRHAAGMPTVIFASSVGHSVNIRDELRRDGVVCEHLDGDTPVEERDAMLARLSSGIVDVVTNCMVLIEGFDCPDLQCIVLARPTKSLLLYRQMVGRGLRPAPGKDHALILDHAGATRMHGYADDPIEWPLKPDRRALSRVHAARTAGSRFALTTCPECKAIRVQGAACAHCGWRPKAKPQQVDVRDGDLSLMERNKRTSPVNATPAERERFYGELLAIERERGYKRGWAAVNFKKKFGAYPASQWATPVTTPTPATRAWVRSRQIAYAKAMQKAGAA